MKSINPGQRVADNVARFQLRMIIEKAEAGGYGPRSGAVLADARAKLKALT